MANLNSVILIGRLTRDSELKYINTGTAVTKFSIANNHKKKSGDQWIEESNFFDVVLWGKIGETLNQYLIKGKEVAIQGELRQQRWDQDGQKRSKIEIVANNIQLLSGASENVNKEASQKVENMTNKLENATSDFSDDIPY